MSKLDNKITELFKKDELPFDADHSIQERLNYHLQLKTASAKVKQNSIIPFFGSLIATKFLGVKISMIVIVLFTYVGYNEINKPNLLFPVSDSINISTPIDTIGSLTNEDSLFIY